MGESPADRLKKARTRRYDSAAECAQAFGWNVNTYKSHENGIRNLNRVAAERYAGPLGVSAAWLLFGQKTRSGDLAPDEKALVEKYRRLSPSGRQAAQAFHDSLIESTGQPPTKPAAKRR